MHGFAVLSVIEVTVQRPEIARAHKSVSRREFFSSLLKLPIMLLLLQFHSNSRRMEDLLYLFTCDSIFLYWLH
jgi:hypothetical protein